MRHNNAGPCSFHGNTHRYHLSFLCYPVCGSVPMVDSDMTLTRTYSERTRCVASMSWMQSRIQHSWNDSCLSKVWALALVVLEFESGHAPALISSDGGCFLSFFLSFLCGKCPSDAGAELVMAMSMPPNGGRQLDDSTSACDGQSHLWRTLSIWTSEYGFCSQPVRC